MTQKHTVIVKHIEPDGSLDEYCQREKSYRVTIKEESMDYVDSGKLRLLEKKSDTIILAENKDFETEIYPFMQTDLLFEEISNLKLKNELHLIKENKMDYARFAEKLTLHAKTEEDVLYPASLLIGEYIKIML